MDISVGLICFEQRKWRLAPSLFLIPRVHFCKSITHVNHYFFLSLYRDWNRLIWTDRKENAESVLREFAVTSRDLIYCKIYSLVNTTAIFRERPVSIARERLRMLRYTYAQSVTLKCRMRRERDIQPHYRDAHRLEFPIYLRDTREIDL